MNHFHKDLGSDPVAAMKAMEPRQDFGNESYAAAFIVMARVVQGTDTSLRKIVSRDSEASKLERVVGNAAHYFEEVTDFRWYASEFQEYKESQGEGLLGVSAAQIEAERERAADIHRVIVVDGGLLSVAVGVSRLCQGDVMMAGSVLAAIEKREVMSGEFEREHEYVLTKAYPEKVGLNINDGEITPDYRDPFFLVAKMRDGTHYQLGSHPAV